MRRASASTPNTDPGLLRLGLLALFLAASLSALSAQVTALASFSVNGRAAGELEFIPGPDEQPLLTSTLLRSLLEGLVRPELLDAVSSRERLVSAADLAAIGVQLVYLPDSLEISLRILPRAALPRDLDRAEAPRRGEGRLVKPEDLSLVMGLGLLLEPRYLPASPERPFRPYFELDLDPALGFFGFVAEASVQSGWREEFYAELDRARVLRDFPSARMRLVGGLIEPRGVSFQSAPSLLGLALYRETSLPEKGSRGPSLGLLELERPAELVFDLNGTIIRRLRLEPGAYRLSELPLSSGLNDLVLTIEEEGGESRVIELGLPWEASLLESGELDWYAAGGLAEDEPSLALASLSAAYGLSRAATLGANFQAGFGSYLGGLSLLWASPLGTFAAEAGLSGGFESGGEALGMAGRLSWRLSIPSKPYLPRLGLGLDYRAAAFSAPAAASTLALAAPAADSYRISAQASQALPWQASLSTAAEARFDGSGAFKRLYCSIGLFQSLSNAAFFSVTTGGDFDATGGFDPSLSFSLSLNPADRRTIQYRHDFIRSADSVDFNLPLSEKEGGSLALHVEGLPSAEAEGLREVAASYRSSLPSAELGISAAFSGYTKESAEWNGAASLRSSLVLAGGRLALVANPGDSLVLLAPDPSLEGELVELRAANGSLLAASRGGRTALASSIRAYEPIDALVEMPESPPELSVLHPELSLEGSYRGVILVRAEAARSLAVRGRLLLANGEPAEGRYGEIYTAGGLYAGMDTFSDETGVFYCYGLLSGYYVIRWAGGGEYAFRLDPDAESQVELGDVRLDKAPGLEEER